MNLFQEQGVNAYAAAAAQIPVIDFGPCFAGKPGALRGATALVHARQKGWFTPTHDAFWAAARAKHGDQAGTRLLIEVLLLHRRMSHAHVIAGTRVTLEAGSVSPDVVAIEARKHAAAAGDTVTVEPSRWNSVTVRNDSVATSEPSAEAASPFRVLSVCHCQSV